MDSLFLHVVSDQKLDDKEAWSNGSAQSNLDTFIFTHTYICTDVWAVLEKPCYCGCVPKVSYIVVIM